jgi:competence protein ComEC
MPSLFPWLVLGFMAGMVLGSWFLLPGAFWGFPAVLVLVLLCGRFPKRPRWIAFVLLFACLGALHSARILPRDLPGNHVIHLVGREAVDLEGVVIQAPEIRQERARLVLEAERAFQGRGPFGAQGRVLITVGRGAECVEYGDRIRVRSRLRAPDPSGNPGGFDWRGHLALQGILVQGFVQDARELLLIRRDQGSWLRQWVEGIRRRISTAIRQEYPTPSREIILSLVTGEAWSLPSSWRDAFAAMGLSHLLAISGLNFGILALMGYGCVRWLLLRSTWVILRVPVEKVAWLLTIPVLLAYGGIAGMGPSVARALIMILALALALVMDRLRGLYHALALAALIILIIHPGSIFEISFQLSFLAVLGILYAVPRWHEALLKRDPLDALGPQPRWRRWWRGLAILAMTSLAALLATLPVSILHFHLVPLLALPANLIMVPLVNVLLQPLALGGCALLLVWPAAGLWVLWICAWLADLVAQGITWGASWSGGIYLPTPRPWEVALFYCLCLGLCNLSKGRWVRWATLGAGLCLAGLWVGEGVERHLEKELRVHCLSVGSGTSILAEGPAGGRMLLDGGGSYDERVDPGSFQVAPLLWHRRIMGLDRVILSHPHPDHAGGLRFILGTFRARELWDNGDRPPTEIYQGFAQAAARARLAPGVLHRGMSWRMGEARVEVLHPPAGWRAMPGRSLSSRVNNGSAVLRISLGDVSFLLPGDIEAEVEARLVSQGGLASTVLVAPHHGSRTSNTRPFLQAVSPRCAVISAQEGPRGILHPEVLGRYQALGVQLFRTAPDGMVSFTTDGRTLRVETYLSQQRIEIPVRSSETVPK